MFVSVGLCLGTLGVMGFAAAVPTGSLKITGDARRSLLTVLSRLGFTNPLGEGGTRAYSDSQLPLLVKAASDRYGIPNELLWAIIAVESNFNPDAVSSAGAVGLMQLMPITAKELGVANPRDPEQNIMGGARYLKRLLSRYRGDYRLALAAYNAGPGAVRKYGGIPPYPETQHYVERVMNFYTQEKQRSSESAFGPAPMKLD